MSEQSFHTAATGDQQLNKSNDSNSQRARTDTTEDNALGDIAKKYEAELMQKRKERQESRALRLQELEKEQRDLDTNVDDQPIPSSKNSQSENRPESNIYGQQRRSAKGSDKDLKTAISGLQTKYDKVRIEREQLEADKTLLNYQVESLKDTLEEHEVQMTGLKRGNKSKHSENEAQKKQLDAAQRKIDQLKFLLEQRDQVIKESGLVAVQDENQSISAVLSQDTAKTLQTSNSNASLSSQSSRTVPLNLSLDSQIRQIALERDTLLKECQNLQDQLDSGIGGAGGSCSDFSSNNPANSSKYSSLSDILKDPLVEHHMAEVKREAQREIADYKLRYHKAEQDIASLQATSNRQLGQVTRYKEQSEHYEAAEDNLKAERRKLTRENGQLKERVEELEITRDHLEKRFEKLRAARHLNNI